MTDRYISASGSNTAPYTSWATAANSTTTAIADVIANGPMAAGDRLFIDKTFVLTAGAALSYVFPTAETNPIQIYSVTNTGLTPVFADISPGATVTTTGGAFAQTWSGTLYVNGVTLNCGTGTTAANINLNPGSQVWENSRLALKTTAGNAVIAITPTINQKTELINTVIEINAANASISASQPYGVFIWRDTPNALQGSIAPSNLFFSAIRCVLDNVDLSAVPNGKFIFPSNNAAIIMLLRNVKISNPNVLASGIGQAFWCDGALVDSVGANFGAVRRRYQGTLDPNSTYHNGTSADGGTTNFSWLVVTNANCNAINPFECTEIVQWVPPGTYSNTVVAVTGGYALTNADVWCEVLFPNTAGTPQQAVVSSFAGRLAIPTGLNLGTWVNGPFAAANKFVLTIPTFTVAVAGYVRFKVKISRASSSIYIDPKAQVA